MRSLRRPLAPLAAAALALGGCATTVTLPELPGRHPASPAAAAAERARPSGVLSDRAPLPSAEPEVGGVADPADHDHLDHGTPGADEPDREAPGHGTGEHGAAHEHEDPGDPQ